MVFYNSEKDVTCVCRGDDFTLVGEEEDLKDLADNMAMWFEIKIRAVMGPDKDDDKEAVILGTTVRWKDWGIEFEADPKHRRILAEFSNSRRTRRRRRTTVTGSRTISRRRMST